MRPLTDIPSDEILVNRMLVKVRFLLLLLEQGYPNTPLKGSLKPVLWSWLHPQCQRSIMWLKPKPIRAPLSTPPISPSDWLRHEHTTPTESIKTNKPFAEHAGKMAAEENHFGYDLGRIKWYVMSTWRMEPTSKIRVWKLRFNDVIWFLDPEELDASHLDSSLAGASNSSLLA